MYQLGNSLFDLDEITRIAAQYPSDPQTNPIGTYGVGVQSDAKHQAASARASDMFYDMLGATQLIPRVIRNPIADTLSFAGGVGVEGIGSLLDYAKSGFKDKNYLTAAKEDIISDWKGTFGTDYGTSTADIMNNVYKENNYTPKSNLNIFNSNMQVEPTYRDTSRNSYLLDNVQTAVQPITTTEPTVIPPPARAVIPNQTKFGPTRSTAIRGGRGGRGNVGARKKTQSSAPVFKSYGPPNMQRY
tara:strand:+ start:25 stop:756 length:732 start_codon:yes stop_codon:yes gene_type:complete